MNLVAKLNTQNQIFAIQLDSTILSFNDPLDLGSNPNKVLSFTLEIITM